MAFWEKYEDRIVEREDILLFVTWMDASVQGGHEVDGPEGTKPGCVLQTVGFQVSSDDDFLILAMERDVEKENGGYRHLMHIPTDLIIAAEEFTV